MDTRPVSSDVDILDRKVIKEVCTQGSEFILPNKRWFGLVVFYGISTAMDYLMSNPIYIYV